MNADDGTHDAWLALERVSLRLRGRLFLRDFSWQACHGEQWAVLGPNSAGKAVKKATADYSVAGIALAASSADGTVIPVLLLPGAFFRTAGG